MAGIAVCLAGFPVVVYGQAKKKNPTSKVYFADVSGDAQIDTGDIIQDLTKKSVFSAQGTIIETKKAESEAEDAKNHSTAVFSNGTGAFFDSDTRVEMKRFVQEPFTPNRSDMDVEPSISQTQAFVARGSVGLCASKLVAGSSMNYQTPQGSVNIQGKKVVIEAANNMTKISMLEGESTVRAGEMDMGGHTIKAGEQAIIRPGPIGMPNIIQISKIPANEMPDLDEKVSMACMAKKTVYFEVKERQETNGPQTSGEIAEGGPSSGTGDADGGPGNPITAFDDNSGAVGLPDRQIVAVEVVPTNLPVEYTVTPARIEAPTRGPGG